MQLAGVVIETLQYIWRYEVAVLVKLILQVLYYFAFYILKRAAPPCAVFVFMV